jgi:hypothetical protein
MPVTPVTEEGINKRIMVGANTDKEQDPISKTARAKRARVWLKQ